MPISNSNPVNSKKTDVISSTKPWRLDHIENIGQALTETASRLPDGIAVACPSSNRPTKLKVRPGQKLVYDRITFSQLEERSNKIAAKLRQVGIKPGMRVALMVPPGIDFVAHVFALYKTNAVTILIDPGMGRKNMIHCLAAARPVSMVGIRKAHLARWVFRKKLTACQINLSTDGWFPGCERTDQLDSISSANPLSAMQPTAIANRQRRSSSLPAALARLKGSFIGTATSLSSRSRFAITFRSNRVMLMFRGSRCSRCSTPPWDPRPSSRRWTQPNRPRSIRQT